MLKGEIFWFVAMSDDNYNNPETASSAIGAAGFTL